MKLTNQPTETELKKMGFKMSIYYTDKGADWFCRSKDNVSEIVYNSGWTIGDHLGNLIDIYPTSKSDIETLIRILSP